MYSHILQYCMNNQSHTSCSCDSADADVTSRYWRSRATPGMVSDPSQLRAVPWGLFASCRTGGVPNGITGMVDDWFSHGSAQCKT